mgnify:CR=1 FL=1
MQRNKYLPLIAVFAAASGALTELHVMFPFPLLPFLEFDMAEIPDMTAFLLLGPEAGIIVALIHCLLLYTLGAFTVFSPLMKFLAEFSMFGGIALAKKFTSNFKIIGLSSVFFRVFIMLFVTLALYYVIMPNIYLPTANLAMSILHISNLPPIMIALLLVGLTSLFNAIAGAITFSVSYGIAKRLSASFKIFDSKLV